MPRFVQGPKTMEGTPNLQKGRATALSEMKNPRTMESCDPERTGVRKSLIT